MGLTTIILALWPDAQIEAIDPLIHRYRQAHQGANVELLHSSKYGQPPRSLQLGSKDKILLHAFGDQALVQVCRLLRSHRASAGTVLDVDTFIFDKPPASTSWNRAMRPDHLLYTALAWTMSLAAWMVDEPPYDSSTWIREDLIESRLLSATTKLCYAAQADGASREEHIGTFCVPAEWPMN